MTSMFIPPQAERDGWIKPYFALLTCQLNEAINEWMDDNPLVSHRIRCMGIVVVGEVPVL